MREKHGSGSKCKNDKAGVASAYEEESTKKGPVRQAIADEGLGIGGQEEASCTTQSSANSVPHN